MKEVDFIREQLMKTGFPVELEMISCLNFRGWRPTPHEYYFDYEESKAREIDIIASRYPMKYAPNFDVFTLLAIECKKSETNAWIFFNAPLKGHFICEGQYADYLRSQNALESFSLVSHLLSHLPHYRKSTLLAVSYTQVQLRKKGERYVRLKDEIFEATNQVTKYVSYEIERYLEAYRKGHYKPESCVFIFPIIVFDGKLYRATLTKGLVSLRRVKHIMLTTFHRPRYSTRRVAFYIDIVTREYFPIYLSILEKEIATLNNKIGKIRDIDKKFSNELKRTLSTIKAIGENVE